MLTPLELSQLVKDPMLCWRLNERHYGNLQGLDKKETVQKYGPEQVQIWRRSFGTPPPLAELSHVNEINTDIEEYLSRHAPATARLRDSLRSKYSGTRDITDQLEYLRERELFEDLDTRGFESYQRAVVDLFENRELSQEQRELLDNVREYLRVRGESLKDTLARVKKWLRVEYLLWDENSKVLVVAHGNSLRALVKMLEKMGNEEILSYNIPTGSPILYELQGLSVVRKDFAEDPEVMAQRAKQVAEQSSKSA